MDFRLTNEGYWTKYPYENTDGDSKVRVYIKSKNSTIQQAVDALIKNMRSKKHTLSFESAFFEEEYRSRQILLRKGSKFSLISDREFRQLEKEPPSLGRAADKTGGGATRLASVEVLNQIPNPRLSTLNSYSGLQKVGIEWKLERHPDNPFSVTLTDRGQLFWRSSRPVSALDVKQIVEYLSSHHRKVHINTGTHGTKSGEIVVTNIKCAEAAFSKEDLATVWNLDNASLHIVSRYAPPIHPENIDVIDAWCYSLFTDTSFSDNQQTKLKDFLKELTSLDASSGGKIQGTKAQDASSGGKIQGTNAQDASEGGKILGSGAIDNSITTTANAPGSVAIGTLTQGSNSQVNTSK